MTIARICERLHCLPSQLEQENAALIESFLAIWKFDQEKKRLQIEKDEAMANIFSSH